MAFELFIKSGRIYTPTVSIWSRGQIGFNQGASQKYNVGNYKYVLLYYDRENRRVGIKFTNDETQKGIIALIKGNTGFTISANAFLKYYDISHEKTRKYAVKYDENDDLYIIDLDKPVGSED